MYSEFAILLKLVVFLDLGVTAQAVTSSEVEGPTFANNVSNVEVRKGQDAQLNCVVDNLGFYRVAWVHKDLKRILAFHNHIITYDSRINVSVRDHKAFVLHITNVQEKDQGWYMCQVNTDPSINYNVYLKVIGDNDPVTLAPEPEFKPEPDSKFEPEPEPEFEPETESEFESGPEQVNDTTVTSGEQGSLRQTSSQVGIITVLISLVAVVCRMT